MEVGFWQFLTPLGAILQWISGLNEVFRAPKSSGGTACSTVHMPVGPETPACDAQEGGERLRCLAAPGISRLFSRSQWPQVEAAHPRGRHLPPGSL